MSKYGKDVTVALTGQQITIEQGFLSAQTLITIIEKSNLPDLKLTVITAIIVKLAEQGVVKTQELISKIYSEFANDPELLKKIIDIIKSIQPT